MDIDFESLKTPLSDEAPCGPDLDMEFDDIFLQFEANLDGLLPSNFSEFYDFRAAGTTLDDQEERCLELLKRTRDLRLMVWAAKIAVLQRDLQGVAGATGLIVHYLTEHWDKVHPQPLDGDLGIRMVNLERIDERAAMMLPIQYAPFVRDRAGELAFRDHLVAIDEVTARDDETFKTREEMDRIVQRCQVENLVAGRDLVGAILTNLEAIRSIWVANAGFENAVKLEIVPPLLERMFAYADELVSSRDPSLAVAVKEGAGEAEDGGGDAGAGEAGAPREGAVKHQGDARAALQAVADYFQAFEPSSPARLLVHQSLDVLGLSFLEVFQRIAPQQVGYANVRTRGHTPLVIPLEQLGAPLVGMEPPAAEAPNQTFEATSRRDALALMADVIRFYRAAEPSSPIPMLLERGRDMVTKDFVSLYAELLENE